MTFKNSKIVVETRDGNSFFLKKGFQVFRNSLGQVNQIAHIQLTPSKSWAERVHSGDADAIVEAINRQVSEGYFKSLNILFARAITTK